MFRVSSTWQWVVAAWIGLLPLLSNAAELRSLYDGDTVAFERAQLIKPRPTTNVSRAFTLAPLIIQEVHASNSPTAPSRVYFQPGSTLLNGLPHEQMTYGWCYNKPQPLERRLPARRGPEIRPRKRAVPEAGAPFLGVRLTLNTNGVPVIYELLGGTRGIEQIFVTQSIEAAAMSKFGPALPGRRHAVERSLNDAPNVVVPRVLDDPPDIMGPILYLQAGTHDLATMICRCMDAQAKQLVGQGFYELVPAAPSGNTSEATRLEAAFPRWLREDFSNQTNRLSRSVNLPAEF
jgi:hypothetical protein